MAIEKGSGSIQIRLSTYEHKTMVHSVKLFVIRSARSRFVGDFESLNDALNYANKNNIEVVEVQNV